MSVRRLADESVQPKSFAFTRENKAWAKETIGKYPKGRQASAVLPLLMRAQEQEGWVTQPAIEHVANMLDMPQIRVLEVATFYTQFQLKPVGTKAHVQVCGTTPCMLCGAEELVRVLRDKVSPEPFETNAAGTLSWEEVECQGACVNAPMVMIGRDTYEDLTAERLEEILDAFEAGQGGTIKPGPQVDRIVSAPASGLTSLTDEKAIIKKRRRGGKRASGKAGHADAEVPPSQAGKPDTHAAETDPAVKTPSPAAARKKGEDAASVEAPAHDREAANHAMAGTSKRRSHSSGRATGAASGQAQTPEDKNRPAAMERPAEPDDLKLISGVGPKIERALNDLGVHTYGQIAAWKKAERDWVDGHLKFRGRIERDDWTKQAKALAKGGPAEYERVFGRKPR